MRKNRTNRYIKKLAAAVAEEDRVRAVEKFVLSNRETSENLELMARNLGVSQILREELPFEGGIFEDAGKLVLKINSLSPHVRQRFTLAHEIGHLMLRRFSRRIDSCGFDADLEDACDAIAAELLMPARQVVPFLASQRGSAVEKLRAMAEVFDVSLQAAAERIHYDLGLWPQSVGLWKFDGEPSQRWFVGRRLWDDMTPPSEAFGQAISSDSTLRTKEWYLGSNGMRCIHLELLHLGRGLVLGVAGSPSAPEVKMESIADQLIGPMDVYVDVELPKLWTAADPSTSHYQHLTAADGQSRLGVVRTLTVRASRAFQQTPTITFDLDTSELEDMSMRLLGLTAGMTYSNVLAGESGPAAEMVQFGGGQVRFRSLVLVPRCPTGRNEYTHLVAYKTLLTSFNRKSDGVYELEFSCFADLDRQTNDRVMRLIPLPCRVVDCSAVGVS